MLLWPEIHTERTAHDRTEGQWDRDWVLGTAGAMNRELRTRCMLQNAKCRRDTKKIAITIWHRRKTCEEKKRFRFLFLAFVHRRKIQIKRKMCKLL